MYICGTRSGERVVIKKVRQNCGCDERRPYIKQSFRALEAFKGSIGRRRGTLEIGALLRVYPELLTDVNTAILHRLEFLDANTV